MSHAPTSTRTVDRSLLVTVGARARLDAAAEWLRVHGGAGAVIVAAAREAADGLLRAALEPGKGLVGVHRLTPDQLAAALATRRLASRGRAPVSRLGLEALATRAVAAAHAEGDLEYLEPVAATPGLPRALARTFAELRLQGVDPDRLLEGGPSGSDLRRLWARLEQTIERFELADPAEVWRTAAESAGQDEHPILGRPLLLLDPAVRGAVEADGIAAVVARAPVVLATAAAGDAEGIEHLENALGVRASMPDDPVDSRLESLRRWVFADGAEGHPEDDSLEFLSAPGESRECVEVARRVLELAAEGVPFDRMAVLLRDPGGYLPLLEEAFRRARVPAHFTRGTIRPHPSGRAFLALLACAAEKLSASRFAEYLSLGQVPDAEPDAVALVEVPWVEPDGAQLVFKSLEAVSGRGNAPRPEGGSDERPEERPDPAQDQDAPVLAGTLQTPRYWEQLLVDAAVVGGLERWRSRLAGLEAEFALRLRDADDTEGRRRYYERQIVGVHNLERFALPVIERLAQLPDEATWGEWLVGLRDLAVLTLRRPDQVLAVLADLEPMADVGPVDLGEVRRSLEERLTSLRVEPEGRRYGKVLVASIEEARGLSFRAVFLPGLAEGIFPRRPAEDPLLLDEWRHRVDGGLADRERRIERERLLLRIAAGAADGRLVVSYPTLDTLQGRARVPSFYALDVARAAEGVLPGAEELERRAAAAAAPRIGWPAPIDPTRAVDAAEYDVAVLAPLLTGESPGEEGRAHYLVGVNEILARSLRTRWKRWRSTFSFADGLVSPDDAARAALDEHRLANRSYSPTALQTYAICPYRFLLYAIHRLRPREEPAPLESMDPLTRGSLFHEVQYALFCRLRDLGELPITEANRPRVTALADEVLDAEAHRYAEELAPAIPRVWRDEIEGLRTDLRGWIRSVAERDGDWVPSYFEFSFGLGAEPGRDPLGRRDEAVVLDGYRLRGSIDLVEKKSDEEAWRVTDHKTGRALREKFVVVGRGEVLQPLLYAMAAEYHLGGRVDAGRLFYCTRRGDYETREVPLNTETRNKAGQILGIVDRAIADGFLPAAPRERACDWCDFRSVCGPYEEMRLRRKDRSALAPLELVRGAP